MKNKWFTDEFFPSICSRIGSNPNYPLSTVISDRQFDMCRKYMTKSRFGYQIRIDGILYTAYNNRGYNILSREITNEEKAEATARSKTRRDAQTNERLAKIRNNPEKFKREFQRLSEKLARAEEAVQFSKEDLEEATAEGDAKNIEYCSMCYNRDLEDVEELKRQLAILCA